jgi:hypothetical protein
MIQPGKFTIMSTSVDDADVIKLELKALDTLRNFCKRPDGKYPPPTDLFTLGPPDTPIKTIDVETRATQVAGKSRSSKYVFGNIPTKD